MNTLSDPLLSKDISNHHQFVQPAGRDQRAVAAGVDFIITIAISSAIFGLGLDLPDKIMNWLMLAPLLYLVFRDIAGGRSLGKRLAGIQLYSKVRNAPMKPLQSIVRNLFLLMPIIIISILAAILTLLDVNLPGVVTSALSMGVIAGVVSTFMSRDDAFHLTAHRTPKT